MRRRTAILTALALLLMASGAWAGDVTSHTFSISHLERNDSTYSGEFGVMGARTIRVFIDEVVGDTLAVDSLIWAVQTKADNGNDNDHDWISGYTLAVTDADSSAYPIEFVIKADVDSLVYDQIRIAALMCPTCDTAWTDSGAAADSGFATYLVRIIGLR